MRNCSFGLFSFLTEQKSFKPLKLFRKLVFGSQNLGRIGVESNVHCAADFLFSDFAKIVDSPDSNATLGFIFPISSSHSQKTICFIQIETVTITWVFQTFDEFSISPKFDCLSQLHVIRLKPRLESGRSWTKRTHCWCSVVYKNCFREIDRTTHVASLLPLAIVSPIILIEQALYWCL